MLRADASLSSIKVVEVVRGSVISSLGHYYVAPHVLQDVGFYKTYSHT